MSHGLSLLHIVLCKSRALLRKLLEHANLGVFRHCLALCQPKPAFSSLYRRQEEWCVYFSLFFSDLLGFLYTYCRHLCGKLHSAAWRKLSGALNSEPPGRRTLCIHYAFSRWLPVIFCFRSQSGKRPRWSAFALSLRYRWDWSLITKKSPRI